MSLFSTLAEAFPNWQLRSADVSGWSTEAWSATHGPWKVLLKAFKDGSASVQITYTGDSPEASDLEDPSPEWLHNVWVRTGDDVATLLREARAKLDAAASFPGMPKPDATLAAQAQKVAAALKGKPKLLNHVLFALKRPKIAGPWTEHRGVSDQWSWSREDVQGNEIAQVLCGMGGMGAKWWVVGNHEQSRTRGSGPTETGAKESADRELRGLGWTLV